MSPEGLTAELAAALSVPKNATRAVLTLEAGKCPILEVTMLVLDGAKNFVLAPTTGDCTDIGAQRIKRIAFMLRLEPFRD